MQTATTLKHVIDSQLDSLDDTDGYVTAWKQALQSVYTEDQQSKRKVRWGGRGRGGRGKARHTFQPKDVVLHDVRLEYVGTNEAASRLLLKEATLKLLSGRVYALIG